MRLILDFDIQSEDDLLVLERVAPILGLTGQDILQKLECTKNVPLDISLYNIKRKSGKGTPKRGANLAYPESFERLWAARPRRKGADPKEGAYLQWQRRVNEGVDPEYMVAQTEKYAKYCSAEIKEKEYVMQTQRWLGKSQPFRQDYVIESPSGYEGVPIL